LELFFVFISASPKVGAMPMIDPGRVCLVAVDLQARLAPAIRGLDALLDRAGLVLRAAARLDVPVLITEQYPKGLGGTLPEVLALAPGAPRIEKLAFSAWSEAELPARVAALGRDQILMLGTEAHVCLMQTGLDMLAAAQELFVVADAVGARDPANVELALRRLERAGATLVSAEMAVFELLRRADTKAFRDLLPLIK
jgi:nicotinamidase-related amidase